MFGYNYKLTSVNPEKNIVKLTPTIGTYAKAFAPGLVLMAGVTLLGAFYYVKDEPDLTDLETDLED